MCSGDPWSLHEEGGIVCLKERASLMTAPCSRADRGGAGAAEEDGAAAALRQRRAADAERRRQEDPRRLRVADTSVGELSKLPGPHTGGAAHHSRERRRCSCKLHGETKTWGRSDCSVVQTDELVGISCRLKASWCGNSVTTFCVVQFPDNPENR